MHVRTYVHSIKMNVGIPWSIFKYRTLIYMTTARARQPAQTNMQFCDGEHSAIIMSARKNDYTNEQLQLKLAAAARPL